MILFFGNEATWAWQKEFLELQSPGGLFEAPA